MINLKDVITKYPECLENASKLHSYLVDLYPEEKRSITIITTIFECGIADEIKNAKGEIDEITINSYCNRLENVYAYSPKFSRECLLLWTSCYAKNKTKSAVNVSVSPIAEPKVATKKPTPTGKEPESASPKPRKFSAGLKIEGGVLKGIGTCKDKDIVIPDSVTSIGIEAFRGCSGLTSITIGNGVKSIGKWAFFHCSGLTSVTIGNGVTSIGDYAFSNCSKLTRVTIPDSVTSIGGAAFFYCNSLTSINVSENNANYKSIDGNLYSKDGTVLIQYAIGKTATDFTIPDSVTSIGDGAFAGCSSLTSVTIPNSVTSIGSSAFYNCRSLTSINVSENNANYKSIDGNLYSKDGKILIQYAIGKTASSFTIPDSVTSIGYEAFYNCSGLTNITIPDSVKSIGKWAFYDCSSKLKIKCSPKVVDLLKKTGNYETRYF